MVLDRPIIYIDPENQKVWKDSDMPKSFRAGHIVKSFRDLSDSIKDSITNPRRFRKKRKNFLETIYSNLDGNSIEKATNCIIEFARSRGIK